MDKRIAIEENLNLPNSWKFIRLRQLSVRSLSFSLKDAISEFGNLKIATKIRIILENREFIYDKIRVAAKENLWLFKN